MKKFVSIISILFLSFSCSDEKLNEDKSPNELDPKILADIQRISKKFSETLTKQNVIALFKTKLSDIPRSKIIKEYLTLFNSTEQEIANKIINHPFLGLGKSIGAKTQEEQVSFSASVQSLMDQLTSEINAAIANFNSTGDFYGDKQTLSSLLWNVISNFENNIWSDYNLTQSEREILLANAAYQKSTIPDLIELSIVISDSTNGVEAVRVQSWKKFWRVVAVVVVTAVAAAVIGAAAGALIAYANATIAGASAAAVSAAVTAASWVGLYVGASVGTVIGAVQAANGNCPAQGWFQSSVPLVDWEQNCPYLAI